MMMRKTGNMLMRFQHGVTTSVCKRLKAQPKDLIIQSINAQASGRKGGQEKSSPLAPVAGVWACQAARPGVREGRGAPVGSLRRASCADHPSGDPHPYAASTCPPHNAWDSKWH